MAQGIQHRQITQVPIRNLSQKRYQIQCLQLLGIYQSVLPLQFSLPYITEVSQSADLQVISSPHSHLLKIHPHMMGTHIKILAISEFLPCMWTVHKCVPHK